jgi:8-oxo-dGTP pyrophosphatase MutT (NUDIX family)/GNAT superfamily N-acetyltransferase
MTELMQHFGAWHPGPFYHGTPAELNPGDLIVPGHEPANMLEPQEHVYASPSAREAESWAREGEGPGSPHAYEVEPTGPFEPDPRDGGASIRSRHPLRVVRKVTTDWGLPHEASLGSWTAADDTPAFPNPYHGTERFGGNPSFSHTWFHGTKGEPEFGERKGHGDEERMATPPDEREMYSGWSQPNQLLGIHFSPLHEVAHKFAPSVSDNPGAIVHARLNFHNPAHFPTEEHLNIAMADWAQHHYPHWHNDKLNESMSWNYNDHKGTHRDFSSPPPYNAGRSYAEHGPFKSFADKAQSLLQRHPHLPEILHGFRQHLEDQGHHGITYGNSLEGPYTAHATRGGQDSMKYIEKRQDWPNGHPYSISAIAQPADIQTTHVEHIAPWRKEPEPHERTWNDVTDQDEPDEMQNRILAYHREHGGAYPRSGRARTASARNCYFCHEPLDPEDIANGSSAHEECEELHSCPVHGEHDDPVLAEQHRDTYTDWDEHLPIAQMHRGLPVQLPRDVHQVVHDTSRPLAGRADALRRHLHGNSYHGSWQHPPTEEERSEPGHLGVHWTDSEPHARAWASDDTYEGPVGHGPKPSVTHVVLHARGPEWEHLETDPDELERRHMYGFGHHRSEREIPLKASAPVHLTGLSWKHGGQGEWNRHDFPEPSRHMASSDGDRFITCERGHEHWGANGAAGLLIRHRGEDGQQRYLLQKRDIAVDNGGTWSIPGGAIGLHETPEQGALREAREELGPLPRTLTHSHTVTSTDCGDWKYHTCIYDSPEHFMTRGGGSTEYETAGTGWFTHPEIEHMRGKKLLHPAFAQSWDKVRRSRGPKTAAAQPQLEAQDYEGRTGDTSHITRTERGLIPTSAVAGLHGAQGEQPGEHRNYRGLDWDRFTSDIGLNGIREPIFITVDHGKEPRISEGNHRRDAAVKLGLPRVPVEICYYGHAEQQGTVWDRHQGQHRTAARQMPITETGPLYHGTTEERARRILAEGFHGGDGDREGVIYLTAHPPLAHSYAEGRVKADGGGTPAVLRVDRVRGVSAAETGYMSPALNRQAGAHYMDKGPAEVLVLDPGAIHGVSRYRGQEKTAASEDIAYSYKERPGGIHHEFYAHDSAGKYVGHVTAGDKGDHVLIEQVNVQPEYRGKGIASRLLDNAINHFSGRELRLKPDPYGFPHPTSLNKDQLRSFYRSHGFEPAEDAGPGYMRRTAAVSTPCQTPDAIYDADIGDRHVSMTVKTPFPLNLSEDEASLLEDNLHNVFELALARYFTSHKKTASLWDSFAPVTAAYIKNEPWDGHTTLYHGGRHQYPLQPGDLITPGHPSNWPEQTGDKQREHVYATDDLQEATGFAEQAKTPHPGRVYEVRPTGPLHPDIEEMHEDMESRGNSYRSRHPLRVVREVRPFNEKMRDGSDWYDLRPIPRHMWDSDETLGGRYGDWASHQRSPEGRTAALWDSFAPVTAVSHVKGGNHAGQQLEPA